jgi:pyrroline-5-carboxylate reductase
MDIDDLGRRGLVLLGCGKMGSALLAGWLKAGLPAGAVTVLEPAPSDWLMGLQGAGLALNTKLPPSPAVVLIAVKPQMMEAALPRLKELGGGETLFLSIAAGTPIRFYEATLGAATPVIRAMPNTPAAIGKGITAIVGNAMAAEAHRALAESLLSAVGEVVRIEAEPLIDAVTAVSGSGPAYVFHLIEALAAAGAAEGLPEGLALKLAKATVAGAGALAEASEETPSQLRIDVTSPGGTTAAALKVLMDEKTGFPALLKRAVHAAAERGRELGK